MNEEIECTNTKSLSLILKELMPGAETLCEPFFGSHSIILSPLDLHFKVKILNDRERGLVNLFELHRVNPELLESLQNKNDSFDVKELGDIDLDSFSSSPFLSDIEDVKKALDAFLACKEILHDIAGIGTDQAMNYIHSLLKPVLVENLPQQEFLTRFDRWYTVFFIQENNLELMDPSIFGGFLRDMKGTLLTNTLEKRGYLENYCERDFTINVKFESSTVGKTLDCWKSH
ncbi:MAG: hypothetical protein ACFFCS_09770 [Candidatus Hodarchaeota archaeon]